jgi:hypothetical protein
MTDPKKDIWPSISIAVICLASIFLFLLTTAKVIAQTSVNQSTQTKGTTLIPNYYFSYAEINGKVQVVPGPASNKLMRLNTTIPPPSSSAICCREIDGDSHPAYEFARIGSFVLNEDALYVCTNVCKWRKLPLSTF